MIKWHERLKNERQSRGWTQRSLAHKIGVSKQTVIRWEKGTAFPYAFYREKLTILFGVNFEERDLLQALPQTDQYTPEQSSHLSDREQVHHEHNVTQPLLTPATQPQLVPSLVQSGQVHEQKRHWATDHLFWPQAFWDHALNHMRNASMFRPFIRFSSRSLLILFTILLAVVLISTTVLSTFIRQPSQVQQQADYGPPFYTLVIQNTDPALGDIALHLQRAFNAVYPRLINRFALDPASAAKSVVTLALASKHSSPASISGRTITFTASWMRLHPNNIGLLTHELTLLVQAYPSEAPGWFASGMADYARSVYGPADDDGWSLPDSVLPQESYTQGGGVAARFLLWLEQHTTLDIIDQLNHAIQTKQSFLDIFRHLTHHTVNELWSQYQAHPGIMQTPEQLYKTFTSRKPLYQSSFRLLALHPVGNSSVDKHLPRLYLSNFAMQADMTIVHGQVYLFFRSDPEIRSDEEFQVYPAGVYRLYISDRHYTHGIYSGFSSAIRQGLNQTNQLTIIAQKHTIYLYINKQFITQVDDSTSNYGNVGAVAMSFGEPTDVRFDNLQVF